MTGSCLPYATVRETADSDWLGRKFRLFTLIPVYRPIAMPRDVRKLANVLKARPNSRDLAEIVIIGVRGESIGVKNVVEDDVPQGLVVTNGIANRTWLDV